MAHVRTQIRNAVVAACTGLAMTGTHVYASRLRSVPINALPALRIYVDDESIVTTSIHEPLLERTCAVRIECVVRAVDGLDDDLDQVALDVEHAIADHPGLGGLLNGPMTLDAVEIVRDEDGDAPVGVLTLRYLAVYHVHNSAVDIAL